MLRNFVILKRLVVLSALLFCLGWFSFMDTGNQVLAAPCCQDCPGFTNPGEEIQYCTDQCGSSSGPCYSDCINDVYECYFNCYYC